MARKSRRRKQQPRQVDRVRHDRGISLHRELHEPIFEVEDRRMYHPRGKYYDYKNIDGTEASFHTTDSDRRDSKPIGQTYFVDPRRVAVCKSRRTRRQVLFAALKAGKRGKTFKKRKYTEKSKVRCT